MLFKIRSTQHYPFQMEAIYGEILAPYGFHTKGESVGIGPDAYIEIENFLDLISLHDKLKAFNASRGRDFVELKLSRRGSIGPMEICIVDYISRS